MPSAGEQVGGGERHGDLGARPDDRRPRVVGLAQDVGAAGEAGRVRDVALAAPERRHALAREREHARAVEVLEHDAPGLGRLGRVGGADDGEVRDRAQREQVLDRLVRRAVLAQADGVVREDPRDLQPHQRRQPDRAAHVVRELQERRAVRPHDPAVGRHAVDRAAHAVLAHAEVDVAPGLAVGVVRALAARHHRVGRARRGRRRRRRASGRTARAPPSPPCPPHASPGRPC